MVLAVGLPELPQPETVLKPSPEVPPGKIVHEVIETTHIKVQHSHNLDVSSFVLTSETVREKNNDDSSTTAPPEIRVIEQNELELLQDDDDDDDELLSKLKEVGDCFEEETVKSYNYVTQHAIKSYF